MGLTPKRAKVDKSEIEPPQPAGKKRKANANDDKTMVPSSSGGRRGAATKIRESQLIQCAVPLPCYCWSVPQAVMLLL